MLSHPRRSVSLFALSVAAVGGCGSRSSLELGEEPWGQETTQDEDSWSTTETTNDDASGSRQGQGASTGGDVSSSGGSDADSGGRHVGSGGSASSVGGSAGMGGTSASGGTSSECDWGYFAVPDAALGLYCQPWRDCSPGQFIARGPSGTLDRACEHCPWGTYSSFANAEECTAWSPCGENEAITTPGSDHSDQYCEVQSNTHITSPHSTGKMVVTSQGAYLLGSSDPEGVAFVLHFSLDGALISTWPLGDEDTTADAIVALGTEIYVSGATGYQRADVSERFGYLRKYSATGDLLWVDVFNAGQYSETAIVATDGIQLVVASAPYSSSDCGSYGGDGVRYSYCTRPVSSPLLLRRYDTQGTLQSSESIDLALMSDLSAHEMTPDGKSYLGCSTDDWPTPNFLAVLGPDGQPVEQFEDGDFEWLNIDTLSIDPAGELNILSRYTNQSIPAWVRNAHKFSSAGMELWQQGLGGYMDPRVPYDLLATSNGVYVAGHFLEGDDPLFIHIAQDGTDVVQTVIPLPYWEALTGVAQGPDGRIYAGGFSMPQAPAYGVPRKEQGPYEFFIMTWPN